MPGKKRSQRGSRERGWTEVWIAVCAQGIKAKITSQAAEREETHAFEILTQKEEQIKADKKFGSLFNYSVPLKP